MSPAQYSLTVQPKTAFISFLFVKKYPPKVEVKCYGQVLYQDSVRIFICIYGLIIFFHSWFKLIQCVKINSIVKVNILNCCQFEIIYTEESISLVLHFPVLIQYLANEWKMQYHGNGSSSVLAIIIIYYKNTWYILTIRNLWKIDVQIQKN